ncbi:MAG: NAD-dependent epimerase/dehydratase family protein [Solirubrobacterales bacterium]
MTAAPLAAVTGGTGFLGRRVVAALRRDGWRVRQLVRTPRPDAGEAVEGSLGDEVALARLVAGADVVVHMAALTRSPDANGFRLINVGGATRLGNAIRAQAPSARVVMVSSLAAREPDLSPFAASKAAAELALLEATRARSYAILRPCTLYGPGDPATLPLFRAARLPVMPVPGRPKARLSLLYVDDAAAAVVKACRSIVGDAFWEVGQGSYSWTAIARAAARALGRDVALMPLPGPLLKAALALARVMTGGRVPITSVGRAEELMHEDWTCDPHRLPPAKVWEPSVNLDDGFAAAVTWYRRSRWL